MFTRARGFAKGLLTVATVGAALTYGTTAFAGAMAVSILEVTAFKIVDATTGVQLTIDIPGVVAGDITILNGNNTADATATLNAVTATQSASANVATGGGAINILQQCVGACPPFAENSYSGVGNTAPPGSTYSLADMVLTGSALDTTAIGGTNTGTDARTRADVSLAGNGNGSSTTNTGADVNFEFTSQTDISIRFTLDYVRQVLAHLAGLAGDAGSAQTSTSWGLTIEDLTANTVQEWDPAALNSPDGSRSILNQPNFAQNSAGSLSSPIFALIAGNNYQLTVRHTSEADASFRVAEPGALATLAIGLICLGLARRRVVKAA